MSKNLIIATISTASLSYLISLLYLFLFQDSLIFRTDLAPREVSLPPGGRRTFIDGLEVGFLEGRGGKRLFYFGGNADNALEFLTLAQRLEGIDIVAMNYPGYGRSQGKPSQETLFKGALTIFHRFKGDKNIIVGRSLGTAVAAFVAAHGGDSVEKVILITPYHSITHLAKLRYPIFPIKLLLRHPFETYRFIERVESPTYVMLAEEDRTTPRSTWELLKPHIKNLREVVVIRESDHGDILDMEESWRVLKRWIKRGD
ncbi:MAG: alpha/beta hydrolase [Epsilonproteobacteria bacterium]|nr:alpha/beta hydrolase [Campylobacterota bacterium]